MINSSILVLLQDAALLLAMLFIYDLIFRQWRTFVILKEAVTGIVVGLVGIALMFTPLEITDGVIFDARCVLLGISGLFFGVMPTTVAMLIIAVARFLIGGEGVMPGVAVIFMSGLFGLLWHKYRGTNDLSKLSKWELWLFGIALSFIYLGAMLLLPIDTAILILSTVTIPMLVVFPLATVLLGSLLSNRLKQDGLASELALSEARMKGLYFHSPTAIWEHDWSSARVALDNIISNNKNTSVYEYLTQHRNEAWKIAASVKVIDVNDEVLKVTGVKAISQLTDNGIVQLFDENTIDRFIEALDAFARGETEYECETNIITLDGEERWLEIRHAVMPGHEQSLKIVLITTLDITDRKKTEEALKLSSSAYENSNEAMSVTDDSGTILSINPAFSKITGFSEAEVIGKTHSILQSGRHDTAFYQQMWDELDCTGQWQGEIWNRRKSGELYAERLSINTINDENNNPYRRIALFTDISQRKESEDLIWRQANFDALTGLPNRRMFLDHLNQEINIAKAHNNTCFLIIVDLDRLKEVNDSLGYLVGDALIKQFADRIKRCLSASAMAARIAGDVFAIILPNLTGIDRIERVVQDIQSMLKQSFKVDANDVFMTSSIGIASLPANATNSEELIQCSNQALENAKLKGRNQRSYFVPSMLESTQQRYVLSKDLRDGIALNQFEVFYQPIINLKSHSVHKAEALIRWHHPEQGFISPADFIPVAEETGAIIEIGNWVFAEAVKQVASWRKRIAPDFQISINKSPVQFNNEDSHIYDWFDDLKQKGLTGDSIVIEMTEGLLMESGPNTVSTLFALNDAGIEIALDDFGTGYSSLSYIKKFDIHYLKIDQSFVQNLGPTSDDSAICESIIAMAHKLNIKVIAEGIETEEQLQLLTEWGCDFGQGYYFCKPVPADQFERKYAS